MHEPGHVFVCKGAAFKPEFLKSALEAGAVAYLCAESHAAELEAIAPTVPALIATDANLRRAMAEASAYVTGHPDHNLTMIGITGTKGKSTTACMLRAILDDDEPYEKTAIMGSIEVFDGIEHGRSLREVAREHNRGGLAGLRELQGHERRSDGGGHRIPFRLAVQRRVRPRTLCQLACGEGRCAVHPRLGGLQG